MSKEEILKKYKGENKVHSIDPFEVFERMEKTANQSMDEYAQNLSIGFAEWISGNVGTYGKTEEGYWWQLEQMYGENKVGRYNKTTAELYQLYLEHLKSL